MDNLNNQTSKPKRKKTVFIVILAILVILFGLFLYVGGYKMLKGLYDDWNTSRKAHEAIQQYNEFLDQYYKTLAEDTYGGKTPQETLDMFVVALEKGDIDLASKYFALDDNLSRKELSDNLKKLINDGRLSEILQILKNAEKSPKDLAGTNSFQFVTWNSDRTLVEHTIFMQFNRYSQVWKIEGF